MVETSIAGLDGEETALTRHRESKNANLLFCCLLIWLPFGKIQVMSVFPAIFSKSELNRRDQKGSSALTDI